MHAFIYIKSWSKTAYACKRNMRPRLYFKTGTLISSAHNNQILEEEDENIPRQAESKMTGYLLYQNPVRQKLLQCSIFIHFLWKNWSSVPHWEMWLEEETPRDNWEEAFGQLKTTENGLKSGTVHLGLQWSEIQSTFYSHLTLKTDKTFKIMWVCDVIYVRIPGEGELQRH